VSGDKAVLSYVSTPTMPGILGIYVLRFHARKLPSLKYEPNTEKGIVLIKIAKNFLVGLNWFGTKLTFLGEFINKGQVLCN
jgi:hypothetical protein